MTLPQSPSSLDYASVEHREAPSHLLVISLLCGLIPLGAGLLILLLYWLTDAGVFIYLGLGMLVIGGIATLVGLMSGVNYLTIAWRATVDRRRAIRNALIALIILLLNIPAAIFCVLVGGSLAMSGVTQTFVVYNNGKTTIDGGTMYQSKYTTTFGAIPPGSSRNVQLKIGSHGPIYTEILRNGVTSKAEVYGDTDEDNFRGSFVYKIVITDEKIGPVE
jgi:hypothetical protein